MKKTILLFTVCGLLILAAVLWLLKGKAAGNIQETGMIAGVFILVGFALFMGISRLRSHLRRETAEDELSKSVMTKASSLAYYASIYLWLFVMYASDKTKLPAHTLIGFGIMGMALLFFLCWLGVKWLGTKHD